MGLRVCGCLVQGFNAFGGFWLEALNLGFTISSFTVKIFKVQILEPRTPGPSLHFMGKGLGFGV